MIERGLPNKSTVSIVFSTSLMVSVRHCIRECFRDGDLQNKELLLSDGITLKGKGEARHIMGTRPLENKAVKARGLVCARLSSILQGYLQVSAQVQTRVIETFATFQDQRMDDTLLKWNGLAQKGVPIATTYVEKADEYYDRMTRKFQKREAGGSLTGLRKALHDKPSIATKAYLQFLLLKKQLKFTVSETRDTLVEKVVAAYDNSFANVKYVLDSSDLMEIDDLDDYVKLQLQLRKGQTSDKA